MKIEFHLKAKCVFLQIVIVGGKKEQQWQKGMMSPQDRHVRVHLRNNNGDSFLILF